ncbi:MAG: Gfo/Idh/MocA family oxidoreductase [Planctomycetota bacterium]|nr:Gfo/Idh/MocA family oxidoreductase [Planctomycetota bacterium]
MSTQFTRRRFLEGTSAAVGAVLAGPLVLRARGAGASPNEKLAIAVVGVAGRGGANLGGVSGEQIVALCDVDDRNLAKAAEKHPKAKRYADFRRMLGEMDRSIDAVVVSTPDHTHAPATATALRMGKHVYCEKPLTHTVHEARVVADLAREKKVATQIGTQIHAGDNYRRVVELVRAGAVGTIDEVHVWSSARYGGNERPTETSPVPEHLDWDLWLGPAPHRPYHPCYLPGRWRGWWDFGSGALGDFGCHYMDLPFWALGLRYAERAEAEGPPVHPESTPLWCIVRYRFAAEGDRPAIRLTWYDGGKRPVDLLKRDGLVSEKTAATNMNPARWSSGVLFVGRDGMLLADYTRHILLPESKFADFQPLPKSIPPSIGHHKEWIRACKTGEPTTCRFDYSGPLTETVLLGYVSYKAGEAIAWDAEHLKATGCPKADRFVRKPYRKGWTL